MVLCEQIKVIDKNRLIKNITSLDRINMNIINRKINISLDLKTKRKKICLLYTSDAADEL